MSITMKTRKEILDWIFSICVAIILSLLVRQYLFQPCQVKMSSMFPTLKENQMILVNKVEYKFHLPKRGDIVVFHSPFAKESYVKRVIGLPGEELEIRNGIVFINGEKVEERYLQAETKGYFGPVQIAYGEIFVMGDNRSNSMDSREFGPILLNSVIGKATMVYWPIKDYKTLTYASVK